MAGILSKSLKHFLKKHKNVLIVFSRIAEFLDASKWSSF